MKVSVIIPVYNLDKYIGRCLDSLLNQDFSDYEIIVVNDGSTDNTETVCKEYEDKYPIIKLINKKNGGVSSARNEGINASSGDYLMFVDGDDYVTENYISTMYKFQIENPDQLIVCDMFKKTESSTEFRKTLHNTEITQPKIYPKEDFYVFYKTHLSCFPFNKIFNREKIIASNIRFDTSLSYGEDAVFVLEYYKICNGFLIVPIPLYNYCILDSGAASKYRKDRFNQIAPSFFMRIPLIKEEHLPEYCDAFLYDFISCLKNTFDNRNTDSFFKKIKYNNSILKSKEFIFCLDHASKKNESPKYINLLKTKNYLIIYLFEKFHNAL